MLDPIGFALEQFDAIGRWRTVDNGFQTIDASGSLPDGTKFNGVAEFRAMLLSHPDRFVGTFAEKILIYGLGRGLDYYDAPTVRRMIEEGRPSKFKFSEMVLATVRSPQFLLRKAAAAPVTQGNSVSK